MIAEKSLGLGHAAGAVAMVADRGHSLTIDGGWRDVATASLEWLRKQGL